MVEDHAGAAEQNHHVTGPQGTHTVSLLDHQRLDVYKRQLMDRAGQHLNLSLPALAGDLTAPEMDHMARVAQKPESVANSRRSLSDYIAVIRGEGLRRSGQSEDALLLAAQKKNLEKKAYMEEKP